MALMNRLLDNLKGNYSWMVWTLPVRCKWTLWDNTPPTQMPTDSNRRATTAKNLNITEINVINWKKKQKEQAEGTQISSVTKKSGADDSIPNNNNNNNNNKNSDRDKRRPKNVYPPCETCGKTHQSTEKSYFGANAANIPPPRNGTAEG